MPSAGTQCWLCDLPVRFDTYTGCSHACSYCFVKRNGKKDLSDIGLGESAKALKKFINGERTEETNWCDWNIPIHWGGMSDPFQPCEAIHRRSLECLKVFAETQYPFIVSSKGKIMGDPEYVDLISKCNCVVQISAVCDSYDILEKGCPTYRERVEIARKIAATGKRVIIRIQPYMHEVFDEVYNNLSVLKDAGVYGVIIEGMKFCKGKKGLVKVGADYTYPYNVIKSDFLKLRSKAHQLGLKIYAGENRIRILGDSLTCCGIDGLEGFEPNKFNWNHLLNGDKTKPTPAMQKSNTGGCFTSLHQNTVMTEPIKTASFYKNMLLLARNNRKHIETVLGVNER